MLIKGQAFFLIQQWGGGGGLCGSVPRDLTEISLWGPRVGYQAVGEENSPLGLPQRPALALLGFPSFPQWTMCPPLFSNKGLQLVGWGTVPSSVTDLPNLPPNSRSWGRYLPFVLSRPSFESSLHHSVGKISISS